VVQSRGEPRLIAANALKTGFIKPLVCSFDPRSGINDGCSGAMTTLVQKIDLTVLFVD
jgi:hypothetical protein